MKVIFAGESTDIRNCPEHSHSEFEIIITLRGEAQTYIGNKSIDVQEGSVAIIPPNILHSHRSEGGYSDMFIKTDSLNIPVLSPIFIKDESDSIKTLGRMLYMTFIQKEKKHREISESLLTTICEYISKFCQNSPKYDFVEALKNAIAHNLSNEEFDIRQETMKIGVSFDYMRHCFKEETGMTPLEYLTKLRIEQAKRYLRHNQFYSVGEIAHLCGFFDRYYFSRCFHKQTGISPKEYRKI